MAGKWEKEASEWNMVEMKARDEAISTDRSVRKFEDTEDLEQIACLLFIFTDCSEEYVRLCKGMCFEMPRVLCIHTSLGLISLRKWMCLKDITHESSFNGGCRCTNPSSRHWATKERREIV